MGKRYTNSMSLGRREIHNSAILKPRFTKRRGGFIYCESFRLNKRHAMVKTKEGYEQCVDCGKIKQGDQSNGIHNSNLNRQ